MAVSATSYFSNSLVGQMQIGSDIDVYGTDLTPKFAVGTGFTRSDGNKYRYAHLGALSNRGILVSTDVSESNLAGGSAINAGALVANITRRAGEVLNPNAVGSRYMQLVITATAQQFEGGYITADAGAGAGFTYRIKGHTTDTGGPVAGNLYMDLYDPIVVAVDSTTDFVIQGSPYANLEAATTTDELPIGVTVTNNSASSYGWVCTHGVTGVLQDATIGALGTPVRLSSGTAGAVMAEVAASNTNLGVSPLVGYMLEPASSTGYSIVYLTLE